MIAEYGHRPFDLISDRQPPLFVRIIHGLTHTVQPFEMEAIPSQDSEMKNPRLELIRHLAQAIGLLCRPEIIICGGAALPRNFG